MEDEYVFRQQRHWVSNLKQFSETDDCVQIEKRELADARWFSSQDVHLMLSGQHADGYFCPPPQAVAHQLIKHSLTLMLDITSLVCVTWLAFSLLFHATL